MPVFSEILNKCLPAARSAFAEQGHSLHLMYLHEVENIRPRPAGEKNYQEFLDEVLHESVMLKLPWSPTSRRALAIEQRSQYLEYLALHSVSADNNLSLDPNYNIFLQLGGHRNFNLKPHVIEKKQDELQSSLKKFNILEEGPLQNALEAISEFHGLKRRSASKDEISWIGCWPHLKMTLRIIDLLATKKWSTVIVGCVFEYLPGKEFGMNDLMAGAEAYINQNKNEIEKIFSFESQVALFL